MRRDEPDEQFRWCGGFGDLVIGTLGDEWLLALGPVPAAAAAHWTVQPFVRGMV
ncbi:hypothetical protein [Paractinoplanes toevensis]|uniref:hypothetical protein n=1 Tax=Paractinoplanes toevensis TaxID=571911 RepID=UPI001BB30D27|nr:hypothetical protein [Actinoplanes toevensis]